MATPPIPSTVVIDGSNVAYEEQTQDSKPKVANLELALDCLHGQYDQMIVIIDAALHHLIDHSEELEKLLRRQTVRQAPADAAADYFVLSTADEMDADVLSNDTFRQYHGQWPWIEHRRIPYMIINGHFILYRPAQIQSRIEQHRREPEPARC